jgi:hypothetical protein
MCIMDAIRSNGGTRSIRRVGSQHASSVLDASTVGYVCGFMNHAMNVQGTPASAEGRRSLRLKNDVPQNVSAGEKKGTWLRWSPTCCVVHGIDPRRTVTLP